MAAPTPTPTQSRHGASAKKKYIRHLKTADADTRLVSAADKLNNVRSILSDYRAIGESVWSRFNGGREGTLWYYRTLRDVFLRHKRNRITRDLELAVNELDALAGGRADFPRPMHHHSPSRHEGMARIIDQIRASKLPSNMMQFAARGALQVPAAENIEILVHLARHNPVFGEVARMTLAGWDEKASLAAAADPQYSRVKCWNTSSHPTICGRRCCPRCWRILRSPKAKLVEVRDRRLTGIDCGDAQEHASALAASRP